MKKEPHYERDSSLEMWWCFTHRRRATHLMFRPVGNVTHHCDPALGGIAAACHCKQNCGPFAPIPGFDEYWAKEKERYLKI